MKKLILMDSLAAARLINAFSARSYHRIMKVARTIADMDDEEIIASHHIGEALSYRVFDKNSVIK